MSKGSTPRGSHEMYRNAPYWRRLAEIRRNEPEGRIAEQAAQAVSECLAQCDACACAIRRDDTLAMLGERVLCLRCYAGRGREK